MERTEIEKLLYQLPLEIIKELIVLAEDFLRVQESSFDSSHSDEKGN